MMKEESAGQGSEKQQSSQPWWFKWLQKAGCVVAGIICSVVGIFVLITLHASCIVAGVFQIVIGFLVILLEAPCCCAYIDFIDKISKFSDNRPPWQKAILYMGLPVLPIILCTTVSTILGNVLVILCGLTFLFESLGKKASREKMLESARGDVQQSTSSSGLVDNAQPISQTPPPQHNNIV